jgi:dCTP deaminase
VILSDREIMAALARGAIGIDPCPPYGSKYWTSTAVDLRLDAEIRSWETLPGASEDILVDPYQEGFNSNALVERFTGRRDCSNGYVIKPGKLVLGWTIERIKLPHQSRIAARVEGKSSLARIGLGVHITAPIIHPGFGAEAAKKNYRGSPIRLEIWNAGPLNIKLTKGMAICQLIFEEVHGTPEQGYSGQFRIQGPESPRRARPSRR